MRAESGSQKRIANLLILLGVLAWLPYFYLLGRGNSPSIFPFLLLHLSGVVPGAWLRFRSDPPKERSSGLIRKRLARMLILVGLLAWAPYVYLTRVTGMETAIGPFLAVHLTGVLGGSALRISVGIERYLNDRSSGGGAGDGAPGSD
jgi:hypothetical protein